MKSLFITLSVLVALAATCTVGWLVFNQPTTRVSDTLNIIDLDSQPNRPSMSDSVEPRSIATTTEATDSATDEEVIIALDEARRCYQTPADCNFANNDPRMEELEAGQNYRSALLALNGAIQDGVISQHEGRLQALEALTAQDGHVQAMALTILAELDTHPDTIYPLLTVVETSHDAKVTEAAMALLSEQSIDGYQPDIDQVLQSSLQTGSVNVSPVIAESILPFLNDANVNDYVDLLLTFPDGSQTQQLLDIMLEEYALMQMGG